MTIVVVNTGVSNLGAIPNMLKRLKAEVVVSNKAADIAMATRLILPGVGHYDAAVKALREAGLIEILTEQVLHHKTPILGICLGMQLFATSSEEGELPGLNWIPGTVRKFCFPRNSRLKIPQMGWNHVDPVIEHPLFTNFDQRMRYYFVHSYHYCCNDPYHCLATTEYGEPYASVVGTDNIVGVQFHPEKSHQFGLKLFENFLKWSPRPTHADTESHSDAAIV